MLLVLLIIINSFTVYKFLFNLIFGSAENFEESVKYSFTPDIISLFKGQYMKDRFGEFKISIFIFSCLIITYIEYIIVMGIVG